MTETNEPLSGNVMPRFGGIATMMRLPLARSAERLDACFVGVPFDGGTSNRGGARFGPRQIRAESSFLRPYNMATNDGPFDRMKVADIGDVPANPYNLPKALDAVEQAIGAVAAAGCIPIAIGGDHTIALPILRAISRVHGPVALIHVDAHADINDEMFGEQLAHGTPVRRAIEEGLIAGDRSWQIGLRGTGYSSSDFDWSRKRGITVVQAEECWHKSLTPLMAKVRDRVGTHRTYLTFDIDSLDPSFAPGTGTPEIGGLTTIQALEVIRGCCGLDLVGCDLVEVSPPYDPSGNTALTAANLLFEMLCVLKVA